MSSLDTLEVWQIRLKRHMSRRPLPFIPTSINFSDIEKGGISEEPIEFGAQDPKIENPLQEESFLWVLKSLPRDRYRVIALLLYMKEELGFDYTYQDIAGIWGCSKVNIHNHIKRMRKSIRDAHKEA